MKKYLSLLLVPLFATLPFTLTSCGGKTNTKASSTELTVETDASATSLRATSEESYWNYKTNVDHSTGEKNHIAGVNSVNTYTLNGRATPLRLLIMDGYGASDFVILGLDEGCVFADNSVVIFCFDDGEVSKATYQRTDPNLIYIGYDERTSEFWINQLKKSKKLELNVPMDNGTSLTYFLPTEGLKWD